MKIQAALDFFHMDDAWKLLDQIHPYIDIIEVGTLLMYAEGFRAVSEIKKRYPGYKILADMKIVDAGYLCAAEAFQKGADIVTAIGMTDDATLAGVVKAAEEFNRSALADMIGVKNPAERAKELEDLGFEYLLAHTAFDLRECSDTPMETYKAIRRNVRRSKTGISGNITPVKIPELLRIKPDWIVVGGAFRNTDDPVAVAKMFKEMPWHPGQESV